MTRVLLYKILHKIVFVAFPLLEGHVSLSAMSCTTGRLTQAVRTDRARQHPWSSPCQTDLRVATGIEGLRQPPESGDQSLSQSCRSSPSRRRGTSPRLWRLHGEEGSCSRGKITMHQVAGTSRHLQSRSIAKTNHSKMITGSKLLRCQFELTRREKRSELVHWNLGGQPKEGSGYSSIAVGGRPIALGTQRNQKHDAVKVLAAYSLESTAQDASILELAMPQKSQFECVCK